MIDLSGLEVSDPDGALVCLGEVIDRPTVIVRVRYYGCPPCRGYLLQLAAQHDEITRIGGGVLGIGPAAPHQARHLRDKGGVPFPMLLDPEHRLAEAIGQERQPLLRFLFHPGGWWRWLKALRRNRQGAITAGWWELPAVVVVDARARMVWSHRGRVMGDYPPLVETLAHLRRAVEQR